MLDREAVRRMRHMRSRNSTKGKIKMDADTVTLGRERRALLSKLSRRRSMIGELQSEITKMQRQLAGIETELDARRKYPQNKVVPTVKKAKRR